MKNELANFTDAVNNLIEGKLILVDKNIEQVLKCVAASPTLRKCLGDAVKAVPYATEFSRARVTWTRPDGTVEARLKLPAEFDRLFAFVVCLLTEVDSGRRNFLDFLKEYYDDSDTNVAYEKFANEVLKPFKQAGEILLHSVDPESLNVEKGIKAERFYNAEKIYVNSDVTASLLNSVSQVRNLFATADSPRKDSVLAACEYFENALLLKNPKILAVSWLALKSLLEMHPFANDLLKEMCLQMSKISL